MIQEKIIWPFHSNLYYSNTFFGQKKMENPWRKLLYSCERLHSSRLRISSFLWSATLLQYRFC